MSTPISPTRRRADRVEAGRRSELLETFLTRISDASEAIQRLTEQANDIAAVAGALCDCLQQGGTVYTCGNGGSAAHAMHLAEELIGRYRSNRPPLRAICLNADPTALTCIANDFGFENVFARQCESLLTKKDLLLVFSTSGNSENLVNALNVAKRKGAGTVGVLGSNGGECATLCDHAIVVESGDSAHIQEAHQVIIHLICEAAERAFT